MPLVQRSLAVCRNKKFVAGHDDPAVRSGKRVRRQNDGLCEVRRWGKASEFPATDGHRNGGRRIEIRER